MENIIKKAIEGGYGGKGYFNIFSLGIKRDAEYYMVLDPLFWQSLGKACGWTETSIKYLGISISKEELLRLLNKIKPFQNYPDGRQGGTIEKVLRMDDIPTWQFHALHFHEINLTQSWDESVKYLTSVI